MYLGIVIDVFKPPNPWDWEKIGNTSIQKPNNQNMSIILVAPKEITGSKVTSDVILNEMMANWSVSRFLFSLQRALIL